MDIHSVRINGKIRAREVRVIGWDNSQLGVMSLSEALTIARNSSQDLIEISSNSVPPVCRIMEFGKWKYQQIKHKTHHPVSKLKEIQITPLIGEHDLDIKVKHAIEFLEDKNKVRLSLQFRGRQMAHKEIGFDKIKIFIELLKDHGVSDSEPQLNGKNISVVISPKKK